VNRIRIALKLFGDMLPYSIEFDWNNFSHVPYFTISTTRSPDPGSSIWHASESSSSRYIQLRCNWLRRKMFRFCSSEKMWQIQGEGIAAKMPLEFIGSHDSNPETA
jgi:hypothetical protein